MNYRTVAIQKTGLIIMALSSSFFILGSFWYAELAAPDNWLLQVKTGLTWGVPAFIFLLIAIWRIKIGIFFAAAYSIVFLFVWALHLIGGDSEPRLIWSLFINTAIYFTGVILVNSRFHKKLPNYSIFLGTSVLLFSFSFLLGLIIEERYNFTFLAVLGLYASFILFGVGVVLGIIDLVETYRKRQISNS